MSDPEQTQSPTLQPTRDIDDDTPMTLEEACREIFRGAIKPATLLAEARRGKLVMERIGRRNFVTRAGIKSMREACRVEPKATSQGSRQLLVADKERTARSSAALEALLNEGRKRKLPDHFTPPAESD